MKQIYLLRSKFGNDESNNISAFTSFYSACKELETLKLEYGSLANGKITYSIITLPLFEF